MPLGQQSGEYFQRSICMVLSGYPEMLSGGTVSPRQESISTSFCYIRSGIMFFM